MVDGVPQEQIKGKELNTSVKLNVLFYGQDNEFNQHIEHVLEENKNVDYIGAVTDRNTAINVIQGISDAPREGITDALLTEFSEFSTEEESQQLFAVLRQVRIRENKINNATIKNLRARKDIPVMIMTSDKNEFAKRMNRFLPKGEQPMNIQFINKNDLIDHGTTSQGMLKALADTKRNRTPAVSQSGLASAAF